MRAFALALVFAIPVTNSDATTAIALRSRYRIVLAADSRVVSSLQGRLTECKLFEVGDVYATASGVVRYGSKYRTTDAIRDGFSRPGDFQSHISATAFYLQRRVRGFLADLQHKDPGEYHSLMRTASAPSDFVELAVAQSVSGQPMLGIIELQRSPGDVLTSRTSICPGNCGRQDDIFYLGYWERIKPYVEDSGRPRALGSAASIDRLIRIEMHAHPDTVGTPINILELTGSGARWLQNGGNCSLPGVAW